MEERRRAAGEQPKNKALLLRIYTALTTYLPARYPEVRTLRDFGRFREDGLYHGLGKLPDFGRKSGEYMSTILEEYGIEPIPWRTRTHRAYELAKKRHPVPEITSDTPVRDFLAAASSRHYRGMNRLATVAHIALRQYLQDNPQIITMGDLDHRLRTEGGLSALKASGRTAGTYFGEKGAENLNRMLATYELEAIPWKTG